MHRQAASIRLAIAPASSTAAVTTGRGDSLFRLASAWRACPKAEASLADEGAGPLFENVTANDRADRAAVSRHRSNSR